MSKIYSLQFGAGDPRTYTGLAPTLLIFVNMTNGATLVAPAMSESLTGSGLYQFTYGVTQPIVFLADAATTSPGTAGRFVSGQIDPSDRADEYGTSLVAQGVTIYALEQALGVSFIAFGNSSIALGNTILSIAGSGGTLGVYVGSTASAAGDSVTDPSTLFGYLKRLAELEQGQSIFTKSTGALNLYDRTGATLFAARTVTNNSSQVIKS